MTCKTCDGQGWIFPTQKQFDDLRSRFSRDENQRLSRGQDCWYHVRCPDCSGKQQDDKEAVETDSESEQ
jgi:DnaJ-class molecular chaperone